MPAIPPMTDYRHNSIRHISFIDIEIGTCEESRHSSAKQQRPYYSINHQKSLICLFAQQISRFALKLITDSLQYKAEKNNHPKPISSTETCTIKQWKRSKESPSERDQCSKCKLPLTTGRIYHHFPVFFRLTETEQQRITSLHKQ